MNLGEARQNLIAAALAAQEADETFHSAVEEYVVAHRAASGGICTRCHEKPGRFTSTGFQRTWCEDCTRERYAELRQLKRASA